MRTPPGPTLSVLLVQGCGCAQNVLTSQSPGVACDWGAHSRQGGCYSAHPAAGSVCWGLGGSAPSALCWPVSGQAREVPRAVLVRTAHGAPGASTGTLWRLVLTLMPAWVLWAGLSCLPLHVVRCPRPCLRKDRPPQAPSCWLASAEDCPRGPAPRRARAHAASGSMAPAHASQDGEAEHAVPLQQVR